jgi:hypothetical protein
MRLTSVQRRVILSEAGFHPYLGGKDPWNPVMPEPITVGPENHGQMLPPDSGERVDPTLLEKIVSIIKRCVGKNYSEEEIELEATKLLNKYLS